MEKDFMKKNVYGITEDGKIIHPVRKMPLKVHVTPLGYGQVFINGEKKLIHPIIAEFFLGPKPEGHDVNHKDCNKLNNSKDNLEYIAHADNKRHHFRVQGYGPRGARKSRVKGTKGFYSDIRIYGK